MGISRQQALDCFRSDDLIGIGMEADAIRRSHHPEDVVSYRCVQQVDLGNAQPAVFNNPTIQSANLRLNCATADRLDDVANLCSEMRARFASSWIEVGLQLDAARDVRTISLIPSWADSGANSVFVDPRQEHGSYVETTTAALEIHRTAHALGMRTTVAIPFGCGESLTERLDYLEAVCRLQDETLGFTSFVPLGLDAPGGRELDGVTAVERLKMLAVTRMVLHNIGHMQSAQVGSGLKVLQTGFRFGANDTEIRLPQPNVTEQDLRRVIRDAGFRPIERDGDYSTMFLN